jgi:murein DD-endopeptidase MepM/ murein hydrolase activator NlpD
MRIAASRPSRSHLIWALGGFFAGALTIAVAVWRAGVIDARPVHPAPLQTALPAIDSAVIARPAPVETPPPVSPPPPPNPAVPPAIEGDPLADLRRRHLSLPLPGLTREELRSNFDEKRGGSRRHEAIDILAPRNTPILAVEDGTIARLFQSDAGGTTIYQFDPATSYVYYYAHLERYANGLEEGARVKRHQVIGYVGTSGNAPKDTPHLHFAIFKLTEKKRWWEGAPIDPFLVLGW